MNRLWIRCKLVGKFADGELDAEQVMGESDGRKQSRTARRNTDQLMVPRWVGQCSRSSQGREQAQCNLTPGELRGSENEGEGEVTRYLDATGCNVSDRENLTYSLAGTMGELRQGEEADDEAECQLGRKSSGVEEGEEGREEEEEERARFKIERGSWWSPTTNDRYCCYYRLSTAKQHTQHPDDIISRRDLPGQERQLRLGQSRCPVCFFLICRGCGNGKRGL